MESKRLDKLESAVFGEKPDGSDGLRHIVTLHSRTLYGTDLDPGGLEKAVRNHTKTMLLCTGALIAFQFLPQVIHFIKEVAK